MEASSKIWINFSMMRFQALDLELMCALLFQNYKPFVNSDPIISNVFSEDKNVNSTDLLVNLGGNYEILAVSGYSLSLCYGRNPFSAADLPTKKVS